MSLFAKDRVLVPIDFSEESFHLLEKTLEFVEDPIHLYIIHVLPHLNPGEPGILWEAIDDESRKFYIRERFYQRFPQPEYQQVHLELVVGDPSSEIIAYAKTNDIQLIVIPSHGRKGLGHFFLGSVAENVVRFAHCPVLVLRR